MSIHKVHLRKLINLFYVKDGKMSSVVRQDVLNQIRKKQGITASGGDFHGPFWSDAKAHLAGTTDLEEQTKSRVISNFRRKRLYPLLTEFFLEWWNEKKR